LPAVRQQSNAVADGSLKRFCEEGNEMKPKAEFR
jgi:hypothetical protein